jgi:hypothetical protein
MIMALQRIFDAGKAAEQPSDAGVASRSKR